MAGTSFVVLPPLSKHGVIFGKNTNCLDQSVQEVIFAPAEDPQPAIKCTYIDIEPTSATKAVILSKSSWTWGAESGANDSGVAIGVQGVWSKDNEGDADMSQKRLLGCDLARLGLEQASNAAQAIDVITAALVKYGQGGSPIKDSDVFHSNAFLIADGNSAWILETSGKHWAAEEVTEGARCLENTYTITTKIDKCSDGLQDYAKEKGLWNGEGDFNFAVAFNVDDADKEEKYQNACKILTNATAGGNFKEINMFELLRHEDLSSDKTMSSQVSTLSGTRPSTHWFTATQDPKKSVFKPFVFTPNAVISKHTVCSDKNEPHTLYALHQAAISMKDVQSLLRSMEQNCVEELDGVIETVGQDLSEFDELLKDCIETEVKFYR